MPTTSAGWRAGPPATPALAALLAAERVAVIGPPGAGKSTLARALAGRLGLPLHHLDRLFHQPGWQRAPDERWQRLQEELAAAPRWLIDGHYGATLPIRLARAQVVLHLDFPRTLCLRRVLARVAHDHGRVRPDMADGCPERLDWAFLRFVWRYPYDSRPRTLNHLRAYTMAGGIVIALGTPADSAALVRAVSLARTEGG